MCPHCSNRSTAKRLCKDLLEKVNIEGLEVRIWKVDMIVWGVTQILTLFSGRYYQKVVG